MREFNPELHEFLMRNETCMWAEKGELKFGVHVYFHAIEDLIKIIGTYALEDGGIECILNNEHTLYIPLEDYFLNNGYTINYYQKCFGDTDWYLEEIKKFDRW